MILDFISTIDMVYFRLLFILFVFSFIISCSPKIISPNDLYYEKADLKVDEAPHFKNSLEWWYFTGHLKDSVKNKELGIEYVFFHFNPLNKKDLIMVNIAISDPETQTFIYDYKIVQLKELLKTVLPLDLAIYSKENLWSLKGQEGVYEINAKMTKHKGAAISLRTTPDKPVLMHRETGYEEYGSYATAGYYSYPRLKGEGKIELEGEEYNVKGEIWYDRQWNCSQVINKEVGWDWFSVQFQDQKEELMLYIVHHYGDKKKIMGGTYFSAQNENIYITGDQIQIEELDYWMSKKSKSNYPSKWRVKIPSLGYDLIVASRIPDQELSLNLLPGRKIHYWEGMCQVTGTKDGKEVLGNSYVEITNRAGRPKPEVKVIAEK
jgi:predicted secreted hydrolase